MNRSLTCIICPNGCEMDVTYEGTQVISVNGNQCPRGVIYAKNEITHPMRTISSSVKVLGGTDPLVSVRLNSPIPKARIMEVMKEIQKCTVEAPVKIGDVVIRNVLGLGCDVIVTKNVGVSVGRLN